jgi:hypothetical protein
VARRAPQQTRSREIRSTFEPSRLSRASVAKAYEHVVPIMLRRMTAKPSSSDGAVPQEAAWAWAPEASSTGEPWEDSAETLGRLCHRWYPAPNVRPGGPHPLSR